jgi:hypothetical protein
MSYCYGETDFECIHCSHLHYPEEIQSSSHGPFVCKNCNESREYIYYIFSAHRRRKLSVRDWEIYPERVVRMTCGHFPTRMRWNDELICLDCREANREGQSISKEHQHEKAMIPRLLGTKEIQRLERAALAQIAKGASTPEQPEVVPQRVARKLFQ